MRVLVLIAGLVAGLLAGLWLVFANPLVLAGRLPPAAGEASEQLRFHPGVTIPLEGTVSSLLGLGGRGMLDSAPANRHVQGAAVIVDGNPGELPAAVVRVSVAASQNALWKARLGTLDYWLVHRPGAGSWFAAGYSNYFDVAGDLAWGTIRGRGRAGLASGYELGALPPASHGAGLFGVSGIYRGAGGDVRGRVSPEAAGGSEWLLGVRLDSPAD